MLGTYRRQACRGNDPRRELRIMSVTGRGTEPEHTTTRVHDDPDVDRAVRELARALAGGAALPEDWPSIARGEPLVREVGARDGTWVVRADRLAPGDASEGTTIVVVVERTDRCLPSDDELRSTYGLTRKEARVARLLAARRSNEEIARELFISPHTARHHTESVLQKLGVRSRGQVHCALMEAGQAAGEPRRTARAAWPQAS
jgi:DNA-binding CsgD family transcriptional regulator